LAGRVVEGDTVRTALGWVARGEADAAVVYATDVRVEPSVKVAFTFPADSHPEIVYPAAVLRGARDATAAGAFLTFCRGGEARAIWQEAGFAVPQ
jgi:molybdate transport system substrate-binding protein